MLFASNWTRLLINLLFLTTRFGDCCIIIGTEQLEQNLCKTKVCSNYGKCRIDESRLVPECVCPAECEADDFVGMLSDWLKHANLTRDELVCGSDGKDYKDFCQLRKMSCQQNKEIKIVHVGNCGLLKYIYLDIFFVNSKRFIFDRSMPGSLVLKSTWSCE